jgi:hypothetical protein
MSQGPGSQKDKSTNHNLARKKIIPREIEGIGPCNSRRVDQRTTDLWVNLMRRTR